MVSLTPPLPLPCDAGMPRCFIYVLTDPDTGEPRYVGKSERPRERYSNHLNDHSRCHRTNWIRSLAAQGKRPGIEIVEEVVGEWPWQESERFWIARLRAAGFRLVNGTSGGDGVAGLSAESRARMSATWRGRKHRPESIAKMRAASTGKRWSAAQTETMRAKMTGRAVTWSSKLAEAIRKLTPIDVALIVARLDDGARVVDLAREFGVHRTTISKVKGGTYAGD